MNFWGRVCYLLDLKNITKKELSISIGINPSNISKGIKDGNIPSADTAVKIAQYLNTTVEYLVTGSFTNPNQNILSETFPYQNKNLNDFQKYSHIIHKLDQIPAEKRIPVERIISDICDTYTSSDSKK